MIVRRMYPTPSYGARGAFEELDRMRRYIDRLSESYFGGHPLGRVLSAGVFPALNLTQDKDKYYVRAELPGMKADALNIEVVGRNLTIAGERQIAQDADVRYHRREREGGSFSRIIGLPGEIDADKVGAEMVNGILTVTLPKAEAAKPKQIAVK
jgi:HSP20 family protein